MEELFDEMLSIKDVTGVMLVSLNGEILYRNFSPSLRGDPESKDWSSFIQSFSDIQETELVFQKKRIYIRKTKAGYLMVLMGLSASMSMVRLNCDVLMPVLTDIKTGKSLKGLFKRK